MSQISIFTNSLHEQRGINTVAYCNNKIDELQQSSTLTTVSSIPNPEKYLKESSCSKQFHVIVVGGGISGLRAASVLKRHGVQITVLEGRLDRLGGRINTIRKYGNVARDIGAAWMHETSQNKLVQLIPKLKIDYYYDDGTPLYFTREGRVGSQFKAKKVADEFADYAKSYYTENPDAPDRAVKEFVEDFVRNHPLLTASERKWAPQATRQVELWIGTSIEQASSKHLSYFMTERNLYLKGGYDRIINWIAQPLFQDPNSIKMGQVVKEINWGLPKVKVKSENSTFTADAVIVTVPLGCLRQNQILFTPSLPKSIQAGIHAFSYGALGKIFVEFEKVFWPKDNDQFVYYPPPPSFTSPFDPDSILSYATVTSNLWIMSGAQALCVQICEPLTQRVELLTSTEVYAYLKPLFNLLRTEPYDDLPKYVNIDMTHWTTDPLAGFGSYSIEKVGDESNLLLEALEENKSERLQFAGEHCIEIGNGCVHGAFETGEKAARNLLEGVLGMKWDGNDTTMRSIVQ
ncbi:Polyamine oxidase FMS1 [Erysiphe neolycopersici]|uniref:Amine oxidase n=1 Tax=Erysiphe neolycopersici TaxID=212602 RepID=A0A420H7Y8_9PEZI|nr:Polyamine oxidase FMS1 [Erysiphe neolycopersici]